MRRFALRFAIAALFAVSAAMPVLAQDKPALPAPDSPLTLSLTVRVTPGNLRKVAGDLGQMMRDGGKSGRPLLNDLLGVVSAEMSLGRGALPATPLSGIRASSDPLVRAVRRGGVGAASEQWTKERAELTGQAVGAGLSLDQACAGAIKTVQQHAAIARSGYDAIAGGLPGLKVADLEQQAQKLTESNAAVRSALTQFDGVLTTLARAAYDATRKALPPSGKR